MYLLDGREVFSGWIVPLYLVESPVRRQLYHHCYRAFENRTRTCTATATLAKIFVWAMECSINYKRLWLNGWSWNECHLSCPAFSAGPGKGNIWVGTACCCCFLIFQHHWNELNQCPVFCQLRPCFHHWLSSVRWKMQRLTQRSELSNPLYFTELSGTHALLTLLLWFLFSLWQEDTSIAIHHTCERGGICSTIMPITSKLHVAAW